MFFFSIFLFFGDHWQVNYLSAIKRPVRQSYLGWCLTGVLPVSERNLTQINSHWQAFLLSMKYCTFTDRYFTCQSMDFLHWQVNRLSVTVQAFLTGKMPVSDIFYMPLTGILPVNQKVFRPLTGNLSVSDKFSKQHHPKELSYKR